MHATTYLRRGFWGRSLEEFKRLSQIALRSEGIKGPSGPYELHSFHDRESVTRCKTMSDVDIGGFSKSHLDWVSSQAVSAPGPPNTASAPATYARFHGLISTELPSGRPDIQRTGYAAWRTLDQPRTLFGKSLWNIDSYAYLAMRVKSDGRSYFVNVQTESLVPTDLHQHRLFSKTPGSWETILIRWSDFVRTNQGFVVEPQAEILRQKVRSVGVGLTDRVPGSFELCIERIWTTNDEREADEGSFWPTREGGLKNKQGETIRWRGTAAR
ncbi:hypothetical protein RB595_003215 [Gaeumannomyces hyphopodioides]